VATSLWPRFSVHPVLTAEIASLVGEVAAVVVAVAEVVVPHTALIGRTATIARPARPRRCHNISTMAATSGQTILTKGRIAAALPPVSSF